MTDRVGGCLPGENHSKAARVQALQQLLFLRLCEQQDIFRVGAAEPVQLRGDSILGEDGKSAHLDFPGTLPAEALHQPASLLVLLKQPFRQRQEVFSRRCQHGPAAAAVPQSQAQLLFQLLYLFGEGGLGDVQTFGCFEKRVFPRRGEKASQLFRRHKEGPFHSFHSRNNLTTKGID